MFSVSFFKLSWLDSSLSCTHAFATQELLNLTFAYPNLSIPPHHTRASTHLSPRSGEFPHSHAPLAAALFDALDAATVVRLLACVLCERRIVLRGSVHAQLVAVADAVMALAHPYV
jgi:hypothetical protein